MIMMIDDVFSLFIMNSNYIWYLSRSLSFSVGGPVTASVLCFGREGWAMTPAKPGRVLGSVAPFPLYLMSPCSATDMFNR